MVGKWPFGTLKPSPYFVNMGCQFSKKREKIDRFKKTTTFFCNRVDALQYFICLQSRKLGQSPMLLVLSSHPHQCLCFAKKNQDLISSALK